MERMPVFEIIEETPETWLYNDFVKAIQEENYEYCAQIRDEFERRFKTHSFCQFAFLVLFNSKLPMYHLLDKADGSYLILAEL